jgi:hypothetical protein
VRPRSVALALVALLLLAGGAAWFAVPKPERDVPAPAATTTTPAAPRPRRRPPSSADDGAAAAAKTTPAAPREEAGWRERLDALLEEGGKDEAAARVVLAEAGRGKAPGGGLHEVLRASTVDVEAARDETARRRAELRIRWAIEEALAPYRRDRAVFAKVYRDVRFGDGRLDAAGGSLVREFRFEEARERMRDLRPVLETWCYDALALRAAEEFARDRVAWSSFMSLCKARGWDLPPPPGSADAKTLTPAETWQRYVLPHLDDPAAVVHFNLVQVFVDLGEPTAAELWLETARRHAAKTYVDRPEDLTRVDAYFAPSEEELEALHALRDAARYRIPASADGLEDWFASHRPTLVAHAVGLDGDVELGAWDDAMTKAFLDGGLPWAPEQWQTQRARLAAAREQKIDGLSGWTATSPNWEVFTDVSAEFAAEATLVLEAGWKQAQVATGVGADHLLPVKARIYKRRLDYQAITHDRSGGHWMPGMNSVLTFLDDPDRTDFRDFRYPTLVHEATHAALSWGVGAGVPAWMHEGLACYVQRWSPTASVALNEGLTRDWVRRPRALAAALAAGTLPSLDGLLSLRSDWDADDFGPLTSARYAAAESLFVHLAGDPERWKLVGAWIAAARKRADPGATPRPPQRGELAKSWKEFVESLAPPPETK